MQINPSFSDDFVCGECSNIFQRSNMPMHGLLNHFVQFDDVLESLRNTVSRYIPRWTFDRCSRSLAPLTPINHEWYSKRTFAKWKWLCGPVCGEHWLFHARKTDQRMINCNKLQNVPQHDIYSLSINLVGSYGFIELWAIIVPWNDGQWILTVNCHKLVPGKLDPSIACCIGLTSAVFTLTWKIKIVHFVNSWVNSLRPIDAYMRR